jgi:hypothetical protein
MRIILVFGPSKLETIDMPTFRKQLKGEVQLTYEPSGLRLFAKCAARNDRVLRAAIPCEEKFLC